MEVAVFEANHVTFQERFDSSSVKMQIAVPTESNPDLLRCRMAMGRIAGPGLYRNAGDCQAGG